MERLRELPKQLQALWQRLSPRARIGIGAVTAAALIALAFITTAEQRIDYSPLYARLDTEDAGAVSEKLRELRVPFRVSGQDTIEVPRDRVAEVRLQLAAAGLPHGGAIGFELFDRQSFGASEHTQRINYQRALQGELERSIGTLAAVRRARVHLVLPERSLFATAEQQPSAAVLLQLHPSRSLATDQVQSVVHLIASSVEGLRPERVTVVDQNNRMLSQKAGPETGQTAALNYQREVERTLSQRAQDLLERTLGKGRAAVQVTAQVDASQVEHTHEEFNPDQQVVRSEVDVEDVIGAGVDSAGGVAGARANLPGGPPPQVTPTEGSRRKSQTKNYEISKVVKKVTEPVGRVQRLTVAVMVDGSYEAVGPTGKGHRYLPRTKEELNAYEAIVKEAVGYDLRRGDQVAIHSLPFAAEIEEAPVIPLALPSWAYALMALGLLGAGAALWRALTKSRAIEAQIMPAGMQLPSSVQQLEDQLRPRAALNPAAAEEAMKVRQQVLDMIASEPDRAVRVLRAWLNEPADAETAEAQAKPEATAVERRSRAHRT